MPHHFTKNTVEAEWWCNPCNQRTMHRIDGGRLGPCLNCIAKLERQRLIKQEAFEERAAIMEFCGNMTREEAERQAREETRMLEEWDLFT